MMHALKLLVMVALMNAASFSVTLAQPTPNLPEVFPGELEGNKWFRIRINPAEYSIELTDVRAFLESNRRVILGSYVDENGISTAADYSLKEVWEVLKKDPDVVAVVSAGYLETASSPQIAGYLKLSGEILNPIMNAPNLTALYCIDNSRFRASADGEPVEAPKQKPYLFVVEFEASRPYQYIWDERTISMVDTAVVNEFPADSRIDEFFNQGCSDIVQIGPRIINPRGIQDDIVDGREQNRFAGAVFTEGKGEERSRVIVSYDLRGGLAFTIFPEPTRLEAIARLLSSDSFYSSSDDCVDRYDQRSLSCEYWAAALTSFEHTGVIVRTSASTVSIIGGSNATIPAALIIRRIPQPVN